jgi:hypothetical protein
MFSWDATRRWVREHSRAATFAWVHGLRSFATFAPPGIFSESSVQMGWPSTQRSLVRLKEVVGTRPLRVWYIPSTPEWDDQVWSTVRQRYSVTERGRFLVKNAVEAWAEGNAIEFIDASVWLRKCPSVGACTFPIDGHWNAEGHRLVGEGLATVTKRVGRGRTLREPTS